MKAESKHQYRFLQKYVNLCELANGVVSNLDDLSKRDLVLSMDKLVEADVVVPLPLKLKITRKLVTDMVVACASTKYSDDCLEKVTSLLKAVRCWEYEMEDNSEWSHQDPSFSPLAAEVADLNKPLLEDSDDEAAIAEATANDEAQCSGPVAGVWH